MTAFKYLIGDTVKFTNPRFGWDEKVFEVIGWKLVPVINDSGTTLGVDLALKETSAAIYQWDGSIDEKAFTYNNTTLPSPFDQTPPNLAVSDNLRTLNEEVVSELIVDVVSVASFIGRYEVEAIKAGDSEYTNIGHASGNRYSLLNVADNAVYTVRARSINTTGVRSEWATRAHQVVGKTAQPNDVTGLTGNLLGSHYILTWSPVPDLDLSHYRVRFAADDEAMNYQNAASLVPKVSRPATSVTVPARNGTYFVKAVDKLGLASESPASIVLSTNIADVEALNVVQSINEQPNFNGAFAGVIESDEGGRLVLNTPLTNGFSEGFYYFSNSVDLGAVYTSRVTSIVKSIRLDYVNSFDSTSGLFDDRLGIFDGDANAFDDTDAQLQVRYTQTDPNGSATWSAWQTFQVSDIKAWGMQFRCHMTTTDSQATPAVSHLSVQIDMPDRTDGANDIASGAGTKVITFDQAFKSPPALGFGAQDMQTGDFYEISAKQRDSFAITFKNSSGTAVNRSFDWVARGYGREVA